jgi:O-antigen/teichoic acid export membrane protein
MSSIRKQSIISSLLVYIGFALGFLNTYFFTKEGSFTEAEFGLTGTFIAIANVMFSFASLGMPSYIHKFFPYYNDNLAPKKNDMLTWAIVVSMVGFLLVILAGILLKGLVIRKFTENAEQLVKYYNWLFPFGFGLTLFAILEAYGWQLRKSMLTNYLREIQFRLFTTILILLFFAGVISGFDQFIKVYSFTYLAVALMMLAYILYSGKGGIHFQLSRVTKKYWKKVVTLASFVWSGQLVYNIASVFDTIIIAAVLPNGLAYAGIFTLAQNIASLIQAPQRGVISASIGPLAQSWKDKDIIKINRIYQRSAINMLVFAVGMFFLIFLNFTDAVETFNLKSTYTQALPVFLFIGLMRILDMGTGVNAQIIATSTFWKFEFFTGMILLAMALPLNYYLTKNLGVIGPAISNLIAFTIYNGIRFVFLWKRYKMQPFTIRTLYAVLLGIVSWVICYFLFRDQHGLMWIILRSSLFAILFIGGIIGFRITPDVAQVILTLKNRFVK